LQRVEIRLDPNKKTQIARVRALGVRGFAQQGKSEDGCAHLVSDRRRRRGSTKLARPGHLLVAVSLPPWPGSTCANEKKRLKSHARATVLGATFESEPPRDMTVKAPLP
jgi:hypothetical protein